MRCRQWRPNRDQRVRRNDTGARGSDERTLFHGAMDRIRRRRSRVYVVWPQSGGRAACRLAVAQCSGRTQVAALAGASSADFGHVREPIDVAALRSVAGRRRDAGGRCHGARTIGTPRANPIARTAVARLQSALDAHPPRQYDTDYAASHQHHQYLDHRSPKLVYWP